MLEKELYSLLLQSLPESFFIAVACFSILNLKFAWNKILLISVLETLTNLIHFLPIAFGMHTVLLPITMALYIRIVTKAKLSRIFAAVIICLIVIIVSEGLYSNPLLKFMNLSYEDVIANPLLRALFSIPEYVALMLIPVVKTIYMRIKQKRINF